MNPISHLRRQFAYEFWANREELRTLTSLPGPLPAAIRLFTHILAAQALWLDRLLGNKPRMAVWPELSLEDCEPHLRELEADWRKYLAGAAEGQLSSACHYTNSKGEPFENAVLDILTHLLLHSACHRGQIALELRKNGQQPAYVDYIHAARQGFLGDGG